MQVIFFKIIELKINRNKKYFIIINYDTEKKEKDFEPAEKTLFMVCVALVSWRETLYLMHIEVLCQLHTQLLTLNSHTKIKG